jgi:hypothetical protein
MYRALRPRGTPAAAPLLDASSPGRRTKRPKGSSRHSRRAK